MITALSLVLVFAAGIAVHRKHQGDAALNAFADALLTVTAFPGQQLRRWTAPAAAAPTDVAPKA